LFVFGGILVKAFGGEFVCCVCLCVPLKACQDTGRRKKDFAVTDTRAYWSFAPTTARFWSVEKAMQSALAGSDIVLVIAAVAVE
jgi:hypothetical protein